MQTSAGELGQEIKGFENKRVTDSVFDFSGLKVYGEGEWKVKKHGKDKRRTWRKLHLAVCPDSHDIVISYLGENSEADCEAVPRMVKHLPRTVKKGFGDGAYDLGSCRKSLHAYGIDPVIPPRRGAMLHNLEAEPWMKTRNDAVRAIVGLGNDDEARKIWKVLAGYHRRSLGETAFYKGLIEDSIYRGSYPELVMSIIATTQSRSVSHLLQSNDGSRFYKQVISFF